ncbi:hypothetical protein VNO80_25841 [Phaseolus coccineus]|uniref:Uncharacterized protein n=1 Tax=Phaseolus coccineus TaxID=3886 RepID=A0AAN9LZC7_PHACN
MVVDVLNITKIAREMVIRPQNKKLGLIGLTKRVGLTDRPNSPDGELIRYRWDDPHVIPADMTLEVSELFTRELSRLILFFSRSIFILWHLKGSLSLCKLFTVESIKGLCFMN